MLKQVLMLCCAFLLMLPAVAFFEVSVLAAGPSVSAGYDENALAVNISGSGFEPGQNYMARLVQRSPQAAIGFINVVADANGNITGSIPTGALPDGLYDLLVTPVGGVGLDSAEHELRIGPLPVIQATAGTDSETVPLTPRRNPQTGEGLPFVLAIAFGFAVLGLVVLCYAFRRQLREKHIFMRFEARKNRLRDLLR